MEAAVVSMALKVVRNKLAPLLIKEYTSIVGVKRDLEELQDQVEEINGWLETRYEAVRNEPSFNWLKRLKDVAYVVDDVVDEFQLKAEKQAAAVADGGIISKYTCTKPKSFILQCKMASKIKKIKRRFAKIVKQRTDYSAIINSIPLDPPVWQTNMRIQGTSSWPDVDLSSVVGRDEDKNYIISKIQETDHQLKIKIISVIGLGGSGKTTLAKLVFNDGTVNKHFEFTLWIHVSQEFDVDKLVKKMFEAFADNNLGQQHDMPYMRKKISEKLAGKRFLLVLDDVWTESQFQWEEFREFLINIGAPGSRILLTTRSSKVAETVGSTDQFLLPLLAEASSWKLFIESCGMAADDLASEFRKVGKEIVEKCGGVPLAIKVLAGVLHGKEDIDQWKDIRDSNLLYVEGEEHRVAACLRFSYFRLPFNLKQCFTICSLFPKGHRIDKEQLIDLWIAHDTITPDNAFDYLNVEYVGHNHFNSLVQMSFLQNVEEKDGRVTCGMHDLVHDLALSILGDEISHDMPNEASSSTTKSFRYFSLIERPDNPAPKNVFKKTRAIYIPQYVDYTYFKAMKHAKHLRSIMVGYGNGKEVDTISQVKYLKYLAMSYRYCETLPKGISDVWSLQALHVTGSYSLLELPKSIGKLKMLRTLNLSGCEKLKCLPDSIGDCEMISSIDLCSCKNLSMLPGSIGNLRKLRTLNLSLCQKLTVLPDSIGGNEKLRVLRLCFTKIERLPSDITALRNLECLDLQDCCELVELPEGIGKLEKLQVLNLNGCKKLGGMPVGIGQLKLLQRLGLFVVRKGENFAGISELSNVSRIEELKIRGISHVMDPNDAQMACLKERTNLKRLNLNWMSDNMEEVNTELQQDVLDGLEPPPGIELLSIHGYSGRKFARWMQNPVGGVQGPFPFLRVMRLCDFPNLKHLHGLVELPCLKELRLERMDSLESISGGPFPSLARLEMTELPCLGEVWMVAERTMPDEEGGCCCSFTPQLGQVWVGNCLTELRISYCPKLEVKPHLPPLLQHLHVLGSEQLLQSPGQCQGSSSPPNFKQLKELELWDVTGLGHGWELLQNMIALDSLKIWSFSGDVSESLWSLTSLRYLNVESCYNIRMLPESLGELRSLQELTIQYCDSLISLPQSIGQLTYLQELVIGRCGALQQLPDCLGGLCSLGKLRIEYLPELTCLPESICLLTTSLQKLEIMDCPSLTSLPQGIEGLASLEMLSIMDCTGLTSLPQGIKGLLSLEELYIYSCAGIQSLPVGIKGLTALKKLWIYNCPDLERRCKREKGEDWHLISHIPHVSF